MKPTNLVPLGMVILITACFVYILLYASFASVYYAKSTYAGINDVQHEAIMAYLKGSFFARNTQEFLTLDEQEHMTDVKQLLDGAFFMNLLAVGVAAGVLTTLKWQGLSKQVSEVVRRSIGYASGALLVLCAGIGVLAFLGFNRFWSGFHHVFFPQGGWAFESGSTLVTLYPLTFFERFTTSFLVRVLVLAVLLLVVHRVMQGNVHKAGKPPGKV